MVQPGDVDGLVTALTATLAAGRRTDEVRAFAERYGWAEPVAELVETFRAAAQEAAR